MNNKDNPQVCVPVNVYTEWAPLEEVIIGSCVNFNLKGIDNTFRFMYENRDGKFADRNEPHRIETRYIEERQEDLDNLPEDETGAPGLEEAKELEK